jgi:hypothetical protein
LLERPQQRELQQLEEQLEEQLLEVHLLQVFLHRQVKMFIDLNLGKRQQTSLYRF